MAHPRPYAPPRPVRKAAFVLLAAWLAGTLLPPASADVTTKPEPRPFEVAPRTELKPLPAAFDKAAPENTEDLRAIQEHVKRLVEKLQPCTVSLRIGQGQG